MGKEIPEFQLHSFKVYDVITVLGNKTVLKSNLFSFFIGTQKEIEKKQFDSKFFMFFMRY